MNVATAAASTALLAFVFWRITLLLPKPEGRTENLTNFHCVHPATLLNKESKCELFYPLINIFISQPVMIILVYSLIQLRADELPYQVFASTITELPVVVQVFLGLLLLDISVWIRHGFVHKFFWSFHSVHHSARELSWMTTNRLHPLDQIVMSLIDVVILYVAGFSAEGMVVAVIIKDLNNLFVHSNVVLDYSKPWKYLIVSPNMHRWHHATEKEAHDKNYCVVFAFVDYLMGTYYVPDNALPAAYGSAQPELDDIEHKTIVTELLQPFKPARAATSASQSGPTTGHPPRTKSTELASSQS